MIYSDSCVALCSYSFHPHGSFFGVIQTPAPTQLTNNNLHKYPTLADEPADNEDVQYKAKLNSQTYY
jgi:hypothetical protein